MGLLPDRQDDPASPVFDDVCAQVAWLQWSALEVNYQVDAMRVGALQALEQEPSGEPFTGTPQPKGLQSH